MGVREVPYYIAFCDCCKEDYDYGDYTAWSDHGAAIDMAGEDLTEIDGRDYCESCWEWSDDEENQVPKGCKHTPPTDSWPCATCDSTEHNTLQHGTGFSAEQHEWANQPSDQEPKR